MEANDSKKEETEMNRKKQLRGCLILALGALIWGIAFVAQNVGMDKVEPFTFNGIRTLLGSVTLLPLLLFRRLKNNGGERKTKDGKKELLIGGTLCGVALFVAGSLQQFAFTDPNASSGKIAFLTALYMIIVPLFGIFLGKKLPIRIWVCVLLGVTGAYLLSVSDGFSISRGDLLAIGCAVAFSFHILLVDRYSRTVDGVELSCLQFFVAGSLGVICMFLFEKPVLSDILSAAVPILYAGVMSCGLGYTFQVIGQKDVDPTVASLIMCFESVFGALAGWVILKETMSLRQVIGCVVMFIAVILTQIPISLKRKDKKA